MASVALPIELDPLIAEAKQRARRRRAIAVAVLLLALGVTLGVELAGGGTTGSPGAVPWLPTKPSLGPAHPQLAAPCTAAQLHAAMSFNGGAGVLFGRMDIVNRSSTACSLVGRPQLSFGGRNATKLGSSPGLDQLVPYDPLAPPIGSLRALAPGAHVAAGLFWGPCLNGGAALGTPQHTGMLTAPGGGVIRVNAAGNLGCHDYSGSVPSVDRFTPVVPQGPLSSELPLRARIVSTGHPFLDGYGKPIHDTQPTLAAQAGSWLSFTVVLTNRGKHTFRFGRTCPAYTEGFSSTPRQAYVLNCHAVGAIAPHASARFAMRVFVPKSESDVSGLLWTLAPHTYHAPQALAWAHVH